MDDGYLITQMTSPLGSKWCRYPGWFDITSTTVVTFQNEVMTVADNRHTQAEQRLLHLRP
jgi:hypothetical protein